VKIRPVGAELFRVVGRTDRCRNRHDEDDSCFLQFSEQA